MKTRDLVVFSTTLIVLFVLGTLFYSIRAQLPTYALYAVYGLGGLGAAGGLCVLIFLVKNMHRHLHGMLLASQEYKEKQYELTERRERWQLEREERLAAVHLQLSRVQPGQYLIRPELTLAPGEQDVLFLPRPGRYHAEQEQLPEHAQSLHAAIPLTVRYEDVQAHIPHGHALLGVSAEGVETCEFGHLLTMWIVGGSSTGKSNTVAIKLDEAIRLGRNIKIILIDPHARKDDSLYNKIRQYEPRFLLPVAVSEEHILHALTVFKQEFDRRLEAGTSDTDILLVVDEVSNVVESDDEAIGKLIKKIVRICGQESRGFGMFGWFISQDAAGLAWLRKRAMTVITHKLNMMSERKLACNDDQVLARSMDHWPIGRVAIYGLHFDGALVAQMPVKHPSSYDEGEKMYPNDEDDMEELQSLPPVFQSQHQEGMGRRAEENGEGYGRHYTTEDLTSPVVLKKILQRAGKMRAEGQSVDAILKAHGLPPGGRMNQNLKHLLDEQMNDESEEL